MFFDILQLPIDHKSLGVADSGFRRAIFYLQSSFFINIVIGWWRDDLISFEEILSPVFDHFTSEFRIWRGPTILTTFAVIG